MQGGKFGGQCCWERKKGVILGKTEAKASRMTAAVQHGLLPLTPENRMILHGLVLYRTR